MASVRALLLHYSHPIQTQSLGLFFCVSEHLIEHLYVDHKGIKFKFSRSRFPGIQQQSCVIKTNIWKTSGSGIAGNLSPSVCHSLFGQIGVSRLVTALLFNHRKAAKLDFLIYPPPVLFLLFKALRKPLQCPDGARSRTSCFITLIH